ncbi:MAG TPA: histidine kinase dimerization/phosphoacceptor domain -containing protein [Alphaproteobacteria bacterium]
MITRIHEPGRTRSGHGAAAWSATPGSASFRPALIRLVLAVLLPLLICGIVLLVMIGQHAREAVVERVKATARLAAEGIDRQMQGHLDALRIVAANAAFDQPDLRALHAELRRIVAAHPAWLSLTVHDAETGRQLLDTRYTPGTPLSDIGAPGTMRALVAGHRPFEIATLTERGPDAASVTVAIRVPVVRQRTTRIVGALLKPDAMQFLLAAQVGGADRMASLSDADGVVVAGTGSVERIVGRRIGAALREQIAGAPTGFLRKKAPDGRSDVYTAYAQSALTGWTIVFGIPAADVDGPWRRTLLISFVGIVASVAAAGGLAVLVGRDLMRRRHEEQLLIRYEADQLVLNIADNFPGLVFRRVQRPEGSVFFPLFDGAARELITLPATPQNARVVQPRLRSLIHPDDQARWRAAIDESARLLLPVRLELRFVSPKPGVTRWVYISAQPFRADNGDTIWDGVIFDISDLKAAEASARESEERLRFALEASHAYSWEYYPVTDRVYRSPNAEEVLCVDPADMEPSQAWFRDRLHPADREHYANAIDTAMKCGGDIEVEFRFLGSDGVYRWLVDRGRVTLGADGRAISAKGVTFDITKVRTLLAQRETLLREVHHRVKNNLQVVSSLLNLQGRAASPELLGHLQDSVARIRAMGRVHDQLYSSESLSHVDFSIYLQMLISDLAGIFAVGGRITSHLDVPPIAFDVDTAMPLGLILTEVIANAYKHAFPGERRGNIFIRLVEVDRRVTVTVRDDGVGLSPDWAARQGSIGMTLIDGLVERLDGRYRFESDGGTVFVLEFPHKP